MMRERGAGRLLKVNRTVAAPDIQSENALSEIRQAPGRGNLKVFSLLGLLPLTIHSIRPSLTLVLSVAPKNN
ncbi:MAG: hypothetical protein A3I89_02635 [Candidatus Harrisonbacteria bacterium RIFCSPLOWO2_02_FULL_41_11]|uniref:Uncharacterized protein n=1 Tax=Candidatus Harrisonbacteria bacterium RIFCSPHIGHO2_02_FULL_42_16 TaxID=1798404 RepID=A0A1G1ZL68_9BACT|nr:MAG: hypothetical protein A3B92_00345 [Candidatus Harrisonbacteria bacterium RIFCSPHIGHO2_02_FULL_42_16]OGY66556.1 MAG: hypothetical protein A3I89_02635 [Candidatus Harrisonbacteria bacterium RIFCSPLOWO2_02_FULL_41_11]